MRPFIRILSVSAVALSLSACATSEPTSPAVMQRMGQDISLTSDNDKSVEIVQAPMSDDQMQQTYTALMTSQNQGSVQVFPIDQPVAPAVPVADLPPTSYQYSPVDEAPRLQGKTYTGDSSVTLFPLDAQAPAGGPHNLSAPGMVPPSSSVMPSPFEQGLGGVYTGQGPSRIYFPHGGTTLNQAGKDAAKLLAAQCTSGSCGIVKVEGHASTRAVAKDEIQRRLINLKISMERAMNVSRQLILDGVPASAIQTTAYGDAVPPSVVEGDAEAAARRVEIKTGAGSPLQY